MWKSQVIHHLSVFLIVALIPFSLLADYKSPQFPESTWEKSHQRVPSGRDKEVFKENTLFREAETFSFEKDKDDPLSAPPTNPDGDNNNYNPGGQVRPTPLKSGIPVLFVLAFLYIGYQFKTRHTRNYCDKE
ncbi:MAG: hypothetical protein LUG18_09855 [Candidatus Azobacteroides sp.]|nr:hypothetical protein [Candidatus Azobacteroides sp.]